MIDVFQLNRQLVTLARPSSFERHMGEYLMSLARNFADKAWVDTLGNVILHRAGSGKKLLVSCHMDTTGLLIHYNDEAGHSFFLPIGDLDASALEGRHMLLESGATGEVVRRQETHGKKGEELSCYDLYLRTGAKTLEGANERAPVGSWAVFDGEPQRLDSDVISGPYADNIAGCITLLLAVERLKNTANDVYFAFTVMQRPIPGSRGVQPVAYNIRPFACITVDGTGTCDTLDTKLRGPLRVGNGPGIKLKEDRYLSDTLVVEHLRGAAKKAGITCQTDIWPLGSTDMVNPTGMGEMAFVQEACGGIFSGGISIPVRNRNTPQEEYSEKDVCEAAMLLTSALESFPA